HVLLSEKGDPPKSVEVKFAGAGDTAPEVIIDGRAAKSRDYLVLRVTAETKHNDIESIPGVADAWKTLRSVVASGGDTTAAYKAFRAAVTFAPELLSSDKDTLIKMVDDLLAKLSAGGGPAAPPPAPGAGQESIISDTVSRVLGAAWLALNAAWKAGS